METQKGKFISVHGIDGTGKTTTAEEVVRQFKDLNMPAINYDTYKNNKNNPISERKRIVDETGTPEEKLAVYLESMMFHSDEIQSLISQGYHVVKSRYLDDIEAHFLHLGIPKEKILQFKEKFPIAQPDLKIVLTLDEKTRRGRINNRGILDERDLDENKSDTRLGFFEDHLLKIIQNAPEGSMLHVDTSIFNPNEVAKKIINYLITDFIK